MDLKLIQKLIVMMKRGGVAELEFKDPKSGLELRLKREGDQVPPQQALSMPMMPQMMPWMGAAMGGAAGATPQVGGAAAGALPAVPAAPAGKPIQSPMVGTFYKAASPEAPPFVTVGMRVTPDTVLCIIEAMKVMNEIKSDVTGEVIEVLVDNGEAVEFGQPLFLVKA